ncbi:MAG: ABC transporter permease [Anaerolineae bacterium]|nr:ABC transporter permease [Anaerolineae bacterium]
MFAHLLELYRFRDLLRNLVARDLKVRYKNSLLGVLWSWLNPLFMMTVYTIVFKVMQPAGQDGIPAAKFPAFILCALLPWNFFSSTVVQSVNVIIDNANLVKKVYFPREILPLSVVLSNLVNFGISLMVLFPMLLLFRVDLTPWALMLPFVILLQVCFVTGIVLLLSTLNVFYRDTKQVIDVAMMAWFFVTPVFYPMDILPSSREILGITLDIRRWTRILNPMASLVAAYRDVLFYGRRVGWDFLARTAVTAVVILAIGYYVFYKYSRRFGEEV